MEKEKLTAIIEMMTKPKTETVIITSQLIPLGKAYMQKVHIKNDAKQITRRIRRNFKVLSRMIPVMIQPITPHTINKVPKVEIYDAV